MLNKRYLQINLLFTAVLLLMFHSCKKDDPTITRLPAIVVETLTVPEQIYGDVLTLAPAITYGGVDATFNYKWSRFITNSAGNNVLKFLSKDKALALPLDSLGGWQLKYEVTNAQTGVTAISTITFNVVSRAERGWYVLKANSEGNTDMDGFLINSKGSEISRNIISGKYGKPLSGNPVAIGFTSVYSWLNPITKTFLTGNSCLMPMSTKEILAYRIKDEKILAGTSDLFFQLPALESRNFQSLTCEPNLMALVNNGKVQAMNPGTNAFLPERTGDYTLSPYFTTAPYLSSTTSYILGFDQKAESFVTVRYKQTDISYFPDNYVPETVGGVAQIKISSNNMGGKLVFMENTDGTLDPITTSLGRAYALLRKDNSTDMKLLGINLQEIQTIANRGGTNSPIRSQLDLPAATYPDLTSATLYTLNKNTPVLYFTKGNVIGAYNIDTKAYNTNIYSFPAGEEITYIKYLDVAYDALAANYFKNLVVATYSNGNYKIYRFTVSGNNFTQTGSLFEGQGRVKSVIYSTPSATTTFSNYMYRYN